MKRSMLFAMGLLMVPVAAQAQLEIGLDAGMALNTGYEVADSETMFSIPTGYARVGVAAGSSLSIEPCWASTTSAPATSRPTRSRSSRA